MGLTAWTTLAESDYSTCFIPGEVSEYKISWAGIPLARSTTTTDTLIENGRELIRIRMEAKSYSRIYKVDDLTEVIIDPKTALPLRIDLSINEGNRQKSYLTTFYHDKKVAIFQDRISKDIREVPIESDTQDIFSFLFSMRNQELKTLTATPRKLFVDGKLYDLGITLQKESAIKLPAYVKVSSIGILPIAEFDGLFLRQGKITFWVSKQNRRMLTCIKAKVPVGMVTIKLQKVSGPGDDFWVKKQVDRE